MSKPPQKQTPKPSSAQPVSQRANAEDEFSQELVKRITALVPGPQREQVIAQVVSLATQERFSGPIAHPRHLRAYEDTCPGAADRIIAMAETDLAHTQNLQEKALTADIADQREGRRLGAAVLFVLVAVAAFLAATGNNVGAGLFLTASMLGAINQIIKGRGSNGSSSAG